jgi:hypothetical protein
MKYLFLGALVLLPLSAPRAQEMSGPVVRCRMGSWVQDLPQEICRDLGQGYRDLRYSDGRSTLTCARDLDRLLIGLYPGDSVTICNDLFRHFVEDTFRARH